MRLNPLRRPRPDAGRGRVALVTGASSGIGAATARSLAKAGFTVYGVARRADRLASLHRYGVQTFTMDVADEASMVAGVERIIAEHGRIDLLVNNAGYGDYGPVETLPLDDARRLLEVDLLGPARLMQLVLPTMRDQRAGRIINVSSLGATIYTPFGGWYHAAKSGIEALSDCARVELAPFGIDVVIYRPGLIATEWGRVMRTHLAPRTDGAVLDEAAAAYAPHTRRTHDAYKIGKSRPASSGPAGAGRAITRAATARRPKSRYTSGRGRWSVPWSRKLLRDRGFDAMIRRGMMAD